MAKKRPEKIISECLNFGWQPMLFFGTKLFFGTEMAQKACTEDFMPFKASDFVWKSIVCVSADFVYHPENA